MVLKSIQGSLIHLIHLLRQNLVRSCVHQFTLNHSVEEQYSHTYLQLGLIDNPAAYFPVSGDPDFCYPLDLFLSSAALSFAGGLFCLTQHYKRLSIAEGVYRFRSKLERFDLASCQYYCCYLDAML